MLASRASKFFRVCNLTSACSNMQDKNGAWGRGKCHAPDALVVMGLDICIYSKIQNMSPPEYKTPDYNPYYALTLSSLRINLPPEYKPPRNKVKGKFQVQLLFFSIVIGLKDIKTALDRF